MYSNSSKQFLIMVPPAVLTLHLKRFEQVRKSEENVLTVIKKSQHFSCFDSTPQVILAGEKKVKNVLIVTKVSALHLFNVTHIN